MTQKKQDEEGRMTKLELLHFLIELESLLHLSTEIRANDLVYRDPIQELRKQAWEMEQRDNLIIKFRKFRDDFLSYIEPDDEPESDI